MNEIVLKIELKVSNKTRFVELALTSEAQLNEFKFKANNQKLIDMGSIMFKSDDIIFVEVCRQ